MKKLIGFLSVMLFSVSVAFAVPCKRANCKNEARKGVEYCRVCNGKLLIKNSTTPFVIKRGQNGNGPGKDYSARK